MAYDYGMAAINLEMTDRVPRTEYSANTHWELIKKVTGMDISLNSDQAQKNLAMQAFMKAWNYDFVWNVCIHGQIFDGFKTSMGHANYEAGGTDFNNKIFCPFEDPEDVLEFDPYAVYGERDIASITDFFNQNYKEKQEFYSDGVNMTGIYVSCMSGLIDIMGWDMLLMAAAIDPEEFGAVTNRYADWIKQYYEALAKCDSPVVMIHDDIVWTSGAFINPEWYRKYIFPNYKKMFAPLQEAGKKIIYTSDGNYTEFIDDIAAVGIDGFVMEPTTDMEYIANKYGKTHSFIGNADTRILLSGTKDDIRREVKRCMDIGKNCPGFFMAVGNHIPSNTPVDNAMWYNEAYEEMGRR